MRTRAGPASGTARVVTTILHKKHQSFRAGLLTPLSAQIMRLGVPRRVPRQDELQRIIDDQTDSWGIKVSVVEVKGVEMWVEYLGGVNLNLRFMERR